MSIYGAMFSGVSGLAAQSQALGMISDNIANVNTVGYKGTVARFHTLVTQAANETHYSPGGVRSTPFQKIDRQGLLQGSASATDVAIIGNGFFVVNEEASPGFGDNYLFTRAGNFNKDESGNLVSPSGYYLQGWRLDATGNLPPNTNLLTSLETVNIANLTGSARATSLIDFDANLPAATAVGDTHSSAVPLFDKQGLTQNLEVVWEKTGTNTWSLTGVLPGTGSFADDDTVGSALDNGQVTPVALATVTFNADGTLQSITAASAFTQVNADNQLEFHVDYDGNAATNSTQDRQLVTLDLGVPNIAGGLTQYNGEDDGYTPLIDQNGLQYGAFVGVTISDQGIVTAVFDNGQQRDIFKLPLATFRNPNGLEAVNGNAYLPTNRSGDALLLEANTAGAGEIAPNSLESSTVDLAEEFSNMIITQRAYSANAKIITTADEMLAELLQIRR
ncbi:flagellar hook protein FlgE [Rhodospirillaceae bacterium SYSU D60014]|uniref:flagellar hook protein FlgE n=1 Tax=Virgifigura deserti TaxID=2268457 RepID=UPI000E66006F